MKVLLFTHKSDIDGMGSIILSKLCYEEVDYVLCESSALKSNLLDYIKDKKIYNYDLVYITDLWLEDEVLELIDDDEDLKGKVYVFDHHSEVLNKDYDFVTLRVKDDKGTCCATSLFYEYLLENKIINNLKNIEEFVELTRRYDTWEWKNIYNDEKANHLNILFKVLGVNGYIEALTDKLKENSSKLKFTISEQNLIDCKLDATLEKVKLSAEKIIYRNINGIKVGIVFIEPDINNDLAEYVRVNNYDMDVIMEICMEKGGISFRNVKEGFGVKSIAEYFGGNGHEYAAGAPISKDMQQKIIDLLLNEAGK